jgi:adenylylsulfate kinase
MKILIFGLPGSGKTTLAIKLKQSLESCSWYNADEIRELHNDFDFSPEGRLRQVNRMKGLADSSETDYVICDFVAPTNQIRKIFNADFSIWMDTIDEGRFEDTNKVFQKPKKADLIISDFNYDIEAILQRINNCTIKK